jgi:hypothetical protein
VTEKWPVLVPSTEDHTITISAAVNPYVDGGPPAGTLVPVEIERVRTNRHARRTFVVDENDTAAVVLLQAVTNNGGVRVYHIDFSYEGVMHTIKVEIP